MKYLMILRHAKSSWKHDGLSDHDRPLNKRGLHDAPRLGRRLREGQVLPERIFSSTAVRACTTAIQVAEAAGLADPPILVPALYLAAAETYLDHLATLDEGLARVMVVGHNPGVEELVEALTGSPTTMSTAALAHVALPIDAWSDLHAGPRGKLLDLWYPRDLPD